MGTVQCRLLGTFQLTVPHAPVRVALDNRKARELLAMLLLSPSKATTREWAGAALWPELDHDHVRKHVRQALWHIHNVVDQGDPDGQRLIMADGERLAINREREPWCDAAAFATTASGCLADHESADRHVEAAIALYRGPLLEGCLSEWCLVERERLEALYLSLLDLATVRAEGRRDHVAAMQWAWQLLRLDPAHERSHRRLMRLYHLAGDRTRALRQLQQCERALQEELGVVPSRRTRMLGKVIRDDADVPAHLRATRQRQRSSVAAPRHAREDDPVVRELASLRRAVEGLREVVGTLR